MNIYFKNSFIILLLLFFLSYSNENNDETITKINTESDEKVDTSFVNTNIENDSISNTETKVIEVSLENDSISNTETEVIEASIENNEVKIEETDSITTKLFNKIDTVNVTQKTDSVQDLNTNDKITTFKINVPITVTLNTGSTFNGLLQKYDEKEVVINSKGNFVTFSAEVIKSVIFNNDHQSNNMDSISNNSLSTHTEELPNVETNSNSIGNTFRVIKIEDEPLESLVKKEKPKKNPHGSGMGFLIPGIVMPSVSAALWLASYSYEQGVSDDWISKSERRFINTFQIAGSILGPVGVTFLTIGIVKQAKRKNWERDNKLTIIPTIDLEHSGAGLFMSYNF